MVLDDFSVTRHLAKGLGTHVFSFTAGAICSDADGVISIALLAHTMYENLVAAMLGSEGERTAKNVFRFCALRFSETYLYEICSFWNFQTFLIESRGQIR